MVPGMIRRVGHVRVFAFLASLVSATLLVFPALPHPLVWVIGRIVIGFCFCGVYVTAESWLNNASSNETRGQALSAYMIVQMAGIISAQALLNVPDASGFLLFVIPSVLVSLSFAPTLLSVQPTPPFEATKPMTLRQVYTVSPLGCVGLFLLGGVFAAQFGMAAVYGKEAGLTIKQISIFIASFYVGALILQYPIGWVSDRTDRRKLIMLVAVVGAIASLVAVLAGSVFSVLLAAAFLIGGCSNPLYSLLIAYTNDFLQSEDMASASAGLLFINGMGAIFGPIIIGYGMQVIGPSGFFMLITLLLALLAAYALYRMTQRPTTDITGSYAPMMMSSTGVAMGAAVDIWTEAGEEGEAGAEGEDVRK